ncbi:excitatory amino acid transporter 3-like isoform X2 [Pecten maximus]|uniref:excitatory amino acid transporter 3-like isoform X2 n=1 Tax=Pecten maximus TaxID=6579 RepID=UPI0014584393|nr:excitatory amino acid transporter 3-like isoform X2 [Pecten maximus]
MAAGDTLRRRRQFLTKCVRRNLLVILLIASMLFGIALGCVVRTMWSPSDTRNIFYLKFPGEIMLNTLKMVSVPLVVSSIISSLASLSMKTSGRIGLRALVYYLVTTVIAVITGTVGIVIISSGKETIEDTSEISKGTSQLDALLDMIRNAFPDNLVEATLSKKQSVLSLRNVEIPIKIAPFDFNHTNANVTRNGPRTVNFTTTDVIKVISIPGTNMLGLIVASIFIGCVLSSMEDKAKPLVDFFQSLYQAMMRLILIFVCAAALPFTMDCLIRKNRIDERVVNFIAPIGATINMDGTALYIPMLTIFISHRLGLTLDAARYIIIGLSAIGVSVGAAAIPGSGLMYMTVAAMAVGLPVEQVILTAPFEWIIERFRTAINVSGDSFGAGIVNHLSYSMLTSEEVELQHTLTSKEEAAESNSLV